MIYFKKKFTKTLYYSCLFIIIMGCTQNKHTTSFSNILNDSLSMDNDKKFDEFCSKIPNINLSLRLSNVDFPPFSYEYSTEMSSYPLVQELGEPLGKIDRDKFVLVAFLAFTSGSKIILQTFTRTGEKICKQSLIGTDGIDSLNDTLKRCEFSSLKMDKDLNIYFYYKDAYVKENSVDTIIKTNIKKYFKIDESGKIQELN